MDFFFKLYVVMYTIQMYPFQTLKKLFYKLPFDLTVLNRANLKKFSQGLQVNSRK